MDTSPLGPVTLQPIGVVRGGRAAPEDDGWDAENCTIELDPSRFGPDSLAGLESFSHVEVVYRFHLVGESDVVPGARRPRGRPDWPEVGIFAQRGRVRPNRLGVTVCRLRSVDGTTVAVSGLDAVDGSPVLDLKPYLVGFAPRGEVVEPAWATEIMVAYWQRPARWGPWDGRDRTFSRRGGP
jgi:tRNA-Thr(GGU) m(6)t(6)A37 methyltransferase TsaA